MITTFEQSPLLTSDVANLKMESDIHLNKDSFLSGKSFRWNGEHRCVGAANGALGLEPL